MLNKALCFLAILSVCSQLGAANNAGLEFVETFDGPNPFEAGTWSFSTNSKYLGQPVKVMPAGDAVPGYENDKGVQLTQEMKHYGFGAKLNSPIKVGGGKDLIIQYELKLVETLNCGGAYIKLLRDGHDISSMDNTSPYTIMFGPDRCGATNKVHFIVQHQNPVTSKWEEKHFNETIPVKTDKKSHLYTLILKADNQFKILVDNKLAREGSLLTHLIPAINPSEEIDDPTDFKPSDWVDDAEIPDPNATKPNDWDESQPRKIPDPNAVKPAGWLDEAPNTIPNPEIQKPDDWDDEEVRNLKHLINIA
jgi:calnexin